MRKILVTGAAGFIGSSLIPELLKNGDVVSGIDNFDNFYDPAIKRENIKDFLNSPDFTLFEGDIRDRDFLDTVLEKTHPEYIIHLAARAGVRPSIDDPELYYDVNVNGTLKLLEAMKKHNITNLIFASSSSVYGNNEKTPFSETDNVDNPISPYAATKKAGELLCYTYHHLYHFNIFCLRFFTVYGQKQRPEMAIQKFGRLIKSGKPITIYGDGSTRRDYTYIDDIIQGIIKSVQNVSGYEILNLGNNKTVSLSELIDSIAVVVGKQAIIEYQSMQPGDVDITYADISKAEKYLEYAPTHSISDGLKKMFGVIQNVSQ